MAKLKQVSWWIPVGMIISMVLLSVIQEPAGLSWAAWVALVPWCLAVLKGPKVRGVIVWSYLTGLGYYLVNLRWLAGVTAAGYGGLCFYMGWYFVFTALVLRWTRRRRWAMVWTLPVLWVAQEYLRALLLTGFPWLFLSHSQHDHLALIQVADLVGAYGVTFVIAMVNGLIVDVYFWRTSGRGAAWVTARRNVLRWGLVMGLVVGGVLGYGAYRLNEGRETITRGPLVSVIQEVIPQYVKESGASADAIYTGHVELTLQAMKNNPGPDLIVWPETMVTEFINDEFLALDETQVELILRDYFGKETPTEVILKESAKNMRDNAHYIDEQLRQLAEGRGALLVGTSARDVNAEKKILKFNSAILYLNDGTKFSGRYDKMHLVPFGEVVPFKRSWPWAYNVLQSLTPYSGYEYSIEAGAQPTVFHFADAGGKPWRFGVAICYEDVMPQVPRRLCYDEQGKRVDFLLNISNDGWFVTGGQNGEPIEPTGELMQHLAICRFRAVENRVGIARAVNTGISAFIEPDGSLTENSRGTLPARLPERQCVKGYLLDDMGVDTRESIYGRTGDWMAWGCLIITLGVSMDGLVQRWRKKRIVSN